MDVVRYINHVMCTQQTNRNLLFTQLSVRQSITIMNYCYLADAYHVSSNMTSIVQVI